MRDDERTRRIGAPQRPWDAIKISLQLRWYRIKWLRFTGAVLVGLYGGMAWLFLVGYVVGVHVVHLRGSDVLLSLAVGCALVSAFGVWVYTAE